MNDYGTDVLAWSERQAELLRRRADGELVNDADFDWTNIAEEVASVGRSERLALRSHIATILEHLIKLQASPASEPRNGWKISVLNARRQIRGTLKDSPSLRREVASIIADETPGAQQDVAAILALYGEAPLAPILGLSFTEQQVLDPWFPADPEAGQRLRGSGAGER